MILEKIDAIEFIEKINSNNTLFKWVKIKIEEGRIDEKTWLKIFNNDWFNIIKDFSEKKRHWNSFFLYNYILKEKMWINDLKEDWVKSKIIKFLSKEFWVKVNKDNMIPVVDANIQYNLDKNTLVLEEWNWLDVDILNDYNKMITSFGDKWGMVKLMTAINIIVYNNNYNLKKWIIVNEKEVLNTLNISNSWNNVKKLRKNMLLLSNLNIITKKKLPNNAIKTSFLRLFNFSIIEKQWSYTQYEIKSNYNSDKKLYIGENLLKLFKKSEHYHLAHRIQTNISQFWSWSFNLEEVMDNMWVNDVRVVKKILKILKENDYLREYSINTNTIYFK